MVKFWIIYVNTGIVRILVRDIGSRKVWKFLDIFGINN